MASSGSESSLTVDDDSSSSEKEPDTDPETLVDAKSAKFNPVIALCCEDKAIKLPQGSKYLHIFELEKAIPDPTKVPIKKSSIEIAAQNAKAKLMAQKQDPTLQSFIAAKSGQTAMALNSKSDDSEKPGCSRTASTNLNSKQKQSFGPPVATTGASTKQESTESQGSQGQQEPFYPIPGRKFLAHQLPVYRPPKKHPNVLTVMEDVSGPLAALREAKKNNRQIKIWTRGIAGIRGYCLAYVQAFDSHWNLALLHVNEVFQRKRAVIPISSEKTTLVANSAIQVSIEEHRHERQEYKSGKYLRDFSKSKSRRQHHKVDALAFNSQSQTQTETCQDMFLSGTKPILIEGPDALLTCRSHFGNPTVGSRSNKSASERDIRGRNKDFNPQMTTTSTPTSKTVKTKSFSDSKSDSSSMSITKSQLRKKRLTIFQEPIKDPFGFLVVARSKHYEIVERFQKHLFLVGNEVAFIELNSEKS